MRRALIVIGKAPVPGKTKTRLVPPLTAAQAATLYGAFLADTVELARQVGWEQTTLIHPRGDGSRLAHLAVALLEQPDDGLGDALAHAFAHHFRLGFDMVVLIGSDNPTLPPQPILAAEVALQRANDLVIGPTRDGGYYLIGMRQSNPALFDEIAWSTSGVYAQTVQRASELGLRVHRVDDWYDVDEAADLDHLRADLASLPANVASHTRSVLRELSLAPAPAAAGPIAPRIPR